MLGIGLNYEIWTLFILKGKIPVTRLLTKKKCDILINLSIVWKRETRFEKV
jgi:hypothetical protein